MLITTMFTQYKSLELTIITVIDILVEAICNVTII